MEHKRRFIEDDVMARNDMKEINAIKLAEWMHIQYEEISKEKNWGTQKKCQVKFKDLPKENQEVMIALAKRLIKKKGLNLIK